MDPLVEKLNIDLLNSNDVGCVINLCSLCNLQFTDNLNPNDEARVEKILDIFLPDDGEHGQVQLCSDCKLLCANLICAKQTLLLLVDKITNLILQSSRFTLVNPKYKIIPKLFQFRFNNPKRNNNNNYNTTASTAANLSLSTLIPVSTSMIPNISSSCNNQEYILPVSSTNYGNEHNLISTYPTQAFVNNTIIVNDHHHQQENIIISSVNQPTIISSTDLDKSYSVCNFQPHLYQNGNKFTEVTSNRDHLENEIQNTESYVVQELTSSVSVKPVNINTDKVTISQNTNVHSPTTGELPVLDAETIEQNISIPNTCNENENATVTINQGKYICEICGKAYRQKKGLRVHLSLHRGEAKYQCGICFKTFTQNSGLKRHIPFHTGENPFKCSQCDKAFKYHTSYNLHKLSHEGTKKYACAACDLTFISSSHLKRHERSHTGEKPYFCTICQKIFSEKYNLEAHIRTHTGENAYKCKHCSAGFDRQIKLNRHIETTHHSEPACQ